MTLKDPTEDIRTLLETDRNWSAYALADLDPELNEHSTWLMDHDALILIYRGLAPPVLFAMGQPNRVENLFRKITQGRYTYTLLGYCRAMIQDRLMVEQENHMWRMALKLDEFPGTHAEGVVKLSMDHLDIIHTLISDDPDQPDSFAPDQLQKGIFYGLFKNDDLISMAGTHIISHWASVAAIGNVFTKLDERGKGFATRVTSAVVKDVLEQGIQTTVLNVGMDNMPALSCYRKLGFWPYCGYYEGTGTLNS